MQSGRGTHDQQGKGKGRSVYDYKTAFKLVDGKRVSIVNSDGKLLEVPREVKDGDGKIIQEGFDPRKHKPLKKSDFADEPAYIRYTADVAEYQAARFAKRAEDLRKKADNLAKFGDPKTRKKISRRERLLKQLQALEAELGEDGIVLSELDTETATA